MKLKNKQRRGINRGALKRVIQNLRELRLDNNEIYLELFRQAINFYLQAEEYQSLKGLEEACLEEIDKQKGRIKIEEKQLLRASG